MLSITTDTIQPWYITVTKFSKHSNFIREEIGVFSFRSKNFDTGSHWAHFYAVAFSKYTLTKEYSLFTHNYHEGRALRNAELVEEA